MPIFEYQCSNCKHKIEKITLKPVKDSTLPTAIIETCQGKCSKAKTRHVRVVSAPAYVGGTPPATSKRVTRMTEMRKPRDPAWKQRVKAGLNPEGKKLTNLRKLNRQEWQETVQTAFPDLKEKQKEVEGRVQKGEYKKLADAISPTK